MSEIERALFEIFDAGDVARVVRDENAELVEVVNVFAALQRDFAELRRRREEQAPPGVRPDNAFLKSEVGTREKPLHGFAFFGQSVREPGAAPASAVERFHFGLAERAETRRVDVHAVDCP